MEISPTQVQELLVAFPNDNVKFTTRSGFKHYIFRNLCRFQTPYILAPVALTRLDVWQKRGYNCGMFETYFGGHLMKFHSDCALDLEGKIGIVALTEGTVLWTCEKQKPPNDKNTVKTELKPGKVLEFSLEENTLYQHRLTFPKGVKSHLLTFYRSCRTMGDLALDEREEKIQEMRNYRSNENRSHVPLLDKLDFTCSVADVTPAVSQMTSLRDGHIVVFDRALPDDTLDKLLEQHKLHDLLLGQIKANRTGCYVGRTTTDSRGITFPLLRCSTQFLEGTHSMKAIDEEVFRAVNSLAYFCYRGNYPKLNHSLFQCYHNHSSIGSHSDKTRDMPRNFMIAFVSFYKNLRNHNQLAKLRFYKKGIKRETLQPSSVIPVSQRRWELNPDHDIEIVLEPNSVVLTTDYINDQYTHTIIETSGEAVRYSYTMRTSEEFAVVKEDGSVELADGQPVVMASGDERKQLKKFYAKENESLTRIEYPIELRPLTVNEGDTKPVID